MALLFITLCKNENGNKSNTESKQKNKKSEKSKICDGVTLLYIIMTALLIPSKVVNERILTLRMVSRMMMTQTHTMPLISTT